VNSLKFKTAKPAKNKYLKTCGSVSEGSRNCFASASNFLAPAWWSSDRGSQFFTESNMESPCLGAPVASDIGAPFAYMALFRARMSCERLFRLRACPKVSARNSKALLPPDSSSMSNDATSRRPSISDVGVDESSSASATANARRVRGRFVSIDGNGLLFMNLPFFVERRWRDGELATKRVKLLGAGHRGLIAVDRPGLSVVDATAQAAMPCGAENIPLRKSHP
jgi:hypothetical protein